MDYALSEEQAQLQSSALRFFSEVHPISRARLALAWTDDSQPALWRQMAEMGWLGMLVPQARGGLGLGVTEAFLVAEAAGRQLLNLPFAASAVLLPLLQPANRSCPRIDQGIDRILLGSACIDVAMAEARYWDYQGQCSDQLVIKGLASDGPGFQLADSSSVQAGSQSPGLDPTLRCAPAPVGSQDLAWTEVCLAEPLRRRAVASWRVVRLAEMLGAAAASLDLSCDYARTREQFGKPIGSNQSIKHQLCNAWMALDNARLAALYAVASLDAGLSDWQRSCAMAEVTGIEACLQVGRYGIQIHGGLGFTWEHDTHLYLKRIQHIANRLDGCEPAYRYLLVDEGALAG
jgi:alkylation response protein AidB-like acyl-CoA dehydrogenase